MWPKHHLLLPADVGLAGWEHDETEETFRGNAYGKAFSLFQATQGRFPVLADDSGICVEALQGAPGVRSARFGTEEAGRALSDSEKNTLLLTKLKEVSDRRARFVCALVLILSAERHFLVQETWEGEVAHQPSGENGFGYDPIFYLPELGKISAELPPELKNQLSHRARATRRLGILLDDLSLHP